MSKPFDPPEISIAETSAKLPPAVWQSLYTAAARTDRIPIVRIRDAGRQFVLIEAEDFDRLQRHWVEYEEPKRSPLYDRIHGNGRSVQ